VKYDAVKDRQAGIVKDRRAQRRDGSDTVEERRFSAAFAVK
jgi:hypothetical protein